MARKKTHPDLYRYVAQYEFNANRSEEGDVGPEFADTPDDALSIYRNGVGQEEGDVVYVYQLVEVRKVRIPTLFDNYVPETK